MSASHSLQQIIDSFPQHYYLLDIESRFLCYNTNVAGFFREAFGREPMPGEQFVDFAPEPYRSQWQKRFRQVLEGNSVSFEEVYDIANEQRQFLVDLKPHFGDSGEVDGIIVASKESAEDEDQLASLIEVRDQLKTALKTREALISIIGHDMRVPIFQLNSLAFMLRNLAKKMGVESFEDHLNAVESDLGFLTSAINNILLWSSNHRDPSVAVRSSFSAKTALDEIMMLLKPEAERKNIAINIEAEGALAVYADRDMITFIMRNLINNAIKFSNDGGSINIRHGAIGGNYIFCVEDCGIGASPEEISRILSGERLHSRVGTQGEKGTGLGLKICHDFVNTHKGVLKLESRNPRGLKVRIEIPCKESKKESLPPAP